MNDEYLKAIGRVTVNKQFLEHLLKSNYSLISGADFYERFDSPTKTFYSFLTTLKEIVEKSYNEHVDIKNKLLDLFDKSIEVNRKRNDIIHSFWFVNVEDPSKPMSKLTFGAKYKDTELNKILGGEFQDFPVEKVHEVADEIKKVAYEWFELLPKLIDISTKHK
ncbi:MAG: hypothetical protein L0Y79_05045 [Chlorobi bacterium]|nr:hypothetical protein [Chlorobiota bacterium]MCI0717007.1 hypothetical protein [Chlorobiota bacterium]